VNLLLLPPAFAKNAKGWAGRVLLSPVVDPELRSEHWAMPKRAVRIVKLVGSVPCVAACTACGQQFTAPVSVLKRLTDAQANLQEQFDRHQCQNAESSAS
jgi:hypothetical protein